MRSLALLSTTLLAVAVSSGCQEANQAEPFDAESLTGSMLEQHQVSMIDAGIIRQRTIYPHHFVTDTAVVNQIGHRDLEVLGRYFAEHGGTLNVAQAGASEQLYQARVNSVVETLRVSGVDPYRVTIGDEPAGGDGMSSQTVLRILEDVQSQDQERTDLMIRRGDRGTSGAGDRGYGDQGYGDR